MKKFLFLFFALFFIFSCSEKKSQENLKNCLEKSPIEDKIYSSYFSFENKNDNLCYYFWFTNNQFFLVNENLAKNIENNLEKDLKTWYFTKDWENEEDLKKHILQIFSHTKYNLLYSEKIDEIFEKINKSDFFEIPTFVIFDEKNILDLYLEKFKELNIILPEKFEKVGNFNKKDILGLLESYSRQTKEKFSKYFVPVPKYFYDMDFENLYQSLLEKQKKRVFSSLF